MSNYGNQSQNTLNQQSFKAEANFVKAQEPIRGMTPIEERAQQLEKELAMLGEAVSNLAVRIDKVLTPVQEDCNKGGGIGQPSHPQSAMTRALDYATRSVEIQRIELVKLAERIEL